jgi:hypothetical protein
MERTLGSLLAQRHFASGRMAFVVGPRQVGKTTLARRLLDERGTPDLYRNWDDLGWRRSVSRDPYGFIDAYRPKPETGTTKPLAALDEVHRFPGWKRYLKGLWDTRKDHVDVIVTSSGRLDVYQKGGDSPGATTVPPPPSARGVDPVVRARTTKPRDPRAPVGAAGAAAAVPPVRLGWSLFVKRDADISGSGTASSATVART